MLNPFFYNVAEVSAQLGLKEIILSPGSRCAPLTIAFNRHPETNIRTISDERSAGYIALGMALETGSPVGLVCTSGTAAANYMPAISEAFYQNVPLVVFTADRPPEWIDQQDGQAIRQQNIYLNHAKKSFQLPVDLEHPDSKWHFVRIISEAIGVAKSYPFGPVHINVPIREPFYPQKDEKITFSSTLNVQKTTEVSSEINLPQQLKNILASSAKVMIIGGQSKKATNIQELLSRLSDKNVVIIGDIISNLHEVKNVINHPDNFLGHIKETSGLKPDLLITFGNSVISKNLKLFIRNNPPKNHWHIQLHGQVADPFQTLPNIIRATPVSFLKALDSILGAREHHFLNHWKSLEDKATKNIKSFFTENPSGEFRVVKELIDLLPAGINLHLANSMAVRYANFIGIENNNITVYSNRGTSGIDGCTSTAVGVALANPNVENLLITGDMAFLYDRNAFWHNYSTENLKILVLNNHGGGIFRMIDGPGKLPEMEELFETQQRSSAKYLAAEFNIKYYQSNDTDFLNTLKDFVGYKGTAIFEYESVGETNHRIFNEFKKMNKESF